jgi:hypothetical protein
MMKIRVLILGCFLVVFGTVRSLDAAAVTLLGDYDVTGDISDVVHLGDGTWPAPEKMCQ